MLINLVVLPNTTWSSGSCLVFKSPHSSLQAGSAGLVTCLKNDFVRFGIPKEITSDGSPKFTSNMTDSFLLQWDEAQDLF